MPVSNKVFLDLAEKTACSVTANNVQEKNGKRIVTNNMLMSARVMLGVCVLVVIYTACGECVGEVVVDFGVAKVETYGEIGVFQNSYGQEVGVNFVDGMLCVAMMGVILFGSINIVAILLIIGLRDVRLHHNVMRARMLVTVVDPCRLNLSLGKEVKNVRTSEVSSRASRHVHLMQHTLTEKLILKF